MSKTYLDDETVRAIAHARISILRARFGDKIPTSALDEGIVVGGIRVPIWNRYKGIFKPAVLGPHGAALSIQTSAASPYGDKHDVELGRISYKFRGTEPLHPDNVALRNARINRRALIYLVAQDPGFYDAIAPVYVTAENADELQFTLLVDQVAYTATEYDTAQSVLRREYVTRAVLQRLHQQQFRRLVLAAYRNQCSICRLKHTVLLDAAHILPDRHPQGDPVISNGLGLCKIHHSAYDANIIGIDSSAVVHVRNDILAEIDGPMLRHGLQEVAGWRLQLPQRVAERPNREFLAERFSRFEAA